MIYTIEVLNSLPESSEDVVRAVQADGHRISEYNRLEFYKYTETDVKRDKLVVASYPNDKVNIIKVTDFKNE